MWRGSMPALWAPRPVKLPSRRYVCLSDCLFVYTGVDAGFLKRRGCLVGVQSVLAKFWAN